MILEEGEVGVKGDHERMGGFCSAIAEDARTPRIVTARMAITKKRVRIFIILFRFVCCVFRFNY